MLAASALSPAPARALEVPELSGRVVDRASLLSGDEARALEEKLEAFEAKTGHQFALLVVPSLEGESIEQYSMRVVEAWKLGDEARDDGLLVLVAPEDRRMRIEVGYGLEGAIPDAFAGRVIRHTLTPAFRAGRFGEGISLAFDQLMAASEGESVRVGPPGRAAAKKSPIMDALVLFMVALVFGSMLFGPRRRGGLPVVVPGRMGGFGGGGGGFGGGFRGGGGGFGGGGASGGW